MKKRLMALTLLFTIAAPLFMEKAHARRRPVMERFHEEARRREQDRAAGKRVSEYSPEVRDFLNRHAISIGTTYTKLKKYIGTISGSPAELRAFKEILSEATYSKTPAAQKALLNRLTTHLVSLKDTNANFQVKASEVERASKEWTIEELTELEVVMRESLGELKEGRSLDQTLKEVFGEEAAKEIKKSCK
jgi:hypothetical protein